MDVLGETPGSGGKEMGNDRELGCDLGVSFLN